jgi:O-antigen/teichoic acid export membrane protein
MNENDLENEDTGQDQKSNVQPRITLDKTSASKAVMWSVVYAGISKLVFPLAGIYITGVLGKEQVGIFMLIMTIVNFSEVIRDAGLTQTYLAEPQMDMKREGAYFGVAILSGLVPAVLLFLCSGVLAAFFKIPDLVWALRLVAGVMLVNGLSTIPRAKMLKDGHIKLSGLFDVIGGGIGLAIAIVLVYSGAGFISLLLNFIFVAVYGLVVNWFRYPVRTVSFSIEAFRMVGRKSLAVLAANGINNLFLFADHTVINQFAGTGSNGLFGVAANLAYKPMDLFIFPLTRTLMVAFSQATLDMERLARVYARSLIVAIMLVLPIYAFLALYAEPILVLLWQEKFRDSIPVLQAMSLYIGCRVLGNISGNVLVPAGKHYQTLYAWIVAAALAAVLIVLVVRTPLPNPLESLLIPISSMTWVQYGLVNSGPFPNPALLMPIVWCFVIGAIFVYGAIVAIGIRTCPPAKPERQRLLLSICVLATSSLVMIGMRFLPILPSYQLLIAILTGPIVHLMLIGTILEKKPFTYINRSGPKRLWSEL